MKKNIITLNELKGYIMESVETDGDFEIEDGVLLKYRGKGGEVDIPAGTTAIAADAFSNCSGLKSVAIPDSVKSIGQNAFKNCRGLTAITLPASVKSVRMDAFEGCENLEDVKLPAQMFKQMVRNPSYAFSGTAWAENVKNKKIVKEDGKDGIVDENMKITLSVRQLKRLIRESKTKTVPHP